MNSKTMAKLVIQADARVADERIFMVEFSFQELP